MAGSKSGLGHETDPQPLSFGSAEIVGPYLDLSLAGSTRTRCSANRSGMAAQLTTTELPDKKSGQARPRHQGCHRDPPDNVPPGFWHSARCQGATPVVHVRLGGRCLSVLGCRQFAGAWQEHEKQWGYS